MPSNYNFLALLVASSTRRDCYGPEPSSWNTFRDANYGASEQQRAMGSCQKEKFFYDELYPSTMAIIMGHREIFEMLRDEINMEDNLDVIGDIITRAVEDEDHGQEILAEILRDYPTIGHQHPAYIEAIERRRWELHPNKRGMLQVLLDARPQLDNQGGVLTNLLPSVISHAPEYLPTFLNKGASLNIPNQEFCKALLAAIDSHGANVESIGMFEDRTALHIAADNGNEAIAKILLDYNADPNAQSVEWGTPLGIASYSDNEAIVKLLIEYGAKVNTISASEHGTALCAAASNGSHSACRLLLDKGADPNCEEALPLLAAIKSKDNILVIEMLLKKGADPMKKNYKHEYPLEKAVYHGRDDIVRLFLKHRANLDAWGSRGSILHAAAASQRKGMVQIMLKLGAKVTEKNDKFGSILQWARPEDYPLLIDNEVKVNPPILGHRYGTAIQAAISRITDPSGDDEKTQAKINEAICYLVEKAGDDIHAVGGFYGTALQAASSRGYLYTVALLLHNGASPNEEGGRCGTALQAAAYHGYLDVVNLLLGKGAKVNQRGGLYDTALQAAAFQGHTEVVELLLKHGANVHLQGGKYDNAFNATKQRKKLFRQNALQKILLSHGAVDDGREYTYDSAEDSDDYDKSSDTFDYNKDGEQEGRYKETKGKMTD
ncbi:hypothetical protein TrVGV298_003869 [Trichoderma virens]|nr:hypothetical protein TrVGV298_003869 [Trichoderma virens]